MEIHPSHAVILIHDMPDPHCPGWKCMTCQQYACDLCRLAADDDLAQPCPGKEWWDA
jgi:hypothetical protein